MHVHLKFLQIQYCQVQYVCFILICCVWNTEFRTFTQWTLVFIEFFNFGDDLFLLLLLQRFQPKWITYLQKFVQMSKLIHTSYLNRVYTKSLRLFRPIVKAREIELLSTLKNAFYMYYMLCDDLFRDRWYRRNLINVW